jgi:hypothetical protein
MLSLADLNRVRSLMVEEIEMDIENGAIYRCPRLTDAGLAQFPELILQAAINHDDTWLGSQMRRLGLFKSHEHRHTAHGIVTARVPHNAHVTLSEGEFNRYYIRAVCRAALEHGASEVHIYRAKAVENPRPESQARVGRRIGAQALLADLRRTNHVDNALGVPAGPNSGLSVQLV